MSISIVYLILSEERAQPSIVTLPPTENVMVLRQKIKEQDAVPLANADITDLDLRVVNFPLDDNLESRLESFRLDDYPSLSPLSEVSSIFDNTNPSADKRVHIIVVAPFSLNLLTVVESETMVGRDILSITIDSRNSVRGLKQAIQEKVPSFNHILPTKLALFNVSLPSGDFLDDERINLDNIPHTELMSKDKLSLLFPRNDRHRLILVRAPTTERRAVKEELGRDCISCLNKRFAQRIYSIYDGQYEQSKPRTSVAPPIELFHPIFAQFLDDVNGTDDIPDDVIDQTTEYMMASSAIYDTERTRRMELTPILCKIFKVDGLSIENDNRTQADVAVELLITAGGFLMFLKNEFDEGGDDPSTQAGLSTGRFWAQPKLKKLRNVTNCPTFVVVNAGPWIVILGAVFTDGLIVQRLTDYIWAGLDSVLSEKHILRVAKIFYALRTGLQNLKSYYESLDPELSGDIPSDSRYFPSINAYHTGEELVRFKYLGFLEDCPDCITFRAQTLTTPPRDIVVKFAERYGERAHRLLADNGLAPKLVYCGTPRLGDEDPSYDSISMVVMEFIDGQTLAMSKLDVEQAETIQQSLTAAVTLLHENGLVFGDLRSPNVMITPEMQIKLIDFNWAGEEGQAKYPFLLSHTLRWPPGVKRLAIIKKEHDSEMLRRMFSEPVPFIVHA